ncbi:MAG: type II toxin-antitoxin system VapC family toxin [Candidatus Lokiarchaeota archaeon]|nr:type II toxin-antitoxin system VapC family toxin [Candidatus Lokiarchaeota archaeon]
MVLTIYFSSQRTSEVKSLMDSIKAGKLDAYMLKHVLIEVYFHICRDQGITEANTQITNFQSQYPVSLVDLDDSLVLHAGKLKCQHVRTLSYIDCMTIAFCLRENAELHTTEKLLKQIQHNTLQRLRFVKYGFAPEIGARSSTKQS